MATDLKNKQYLGKICLTFFTKKKYALYTGALIIGITACKPTATPKTYNVYPGEVANLLLEATNSPTRYSITKPPMHGGMAGNPPKITYISDNNYTGKDEFEFTAENKDGVSNPAKITVNIASSSKTSPVPYSVSPIGLQTTDSTTAKWTALASTTSYDFELRSNSTKKIVTKANVALPEYLLPSDLNRSDFYSWRVRANFIDGSGFFTEWTTFYFPQHSVLPPQLKISEPKNGESLQSRYFPVSGSLEDVTSLVTVNSEPACNYNGSFYANNIHIDGDSLAVNASALQPGEPPSTDSVNVVSLLPTNAWALLPDVFCGASPLAVNFAISGNVTSLSKIEIDTNLDGVSDYSFSPSALPQNISFVDIGVHKIKATFTSTSNESSYQYLYIVARDPMRETYFDNLYYQRAWFILQDGIIQKNKEKISSILSDNLKIKFSGVINQIIKGGGTEAQFSHLEPLSANGTDRDYIFLEEKNGEAKVYTIGFSLGKIVSL